MTILSINVYAVNCCNAKLSLSYFFSNGSFLCNSFFSSLSTLSVGSSSGSTQRALPGGRPLGIQGPQVSSGSVFPPSSVPEPSSDPLQLNHSSSSSSSQRSSYYGPFPASTSGAPSSPFGSPFYNFSMVNSLIYPREGSEV